MSNVIKKDGSIEPWNVEKIVRAITLASSRTKEVITPEQVTEITSFVFSKVTTPTITVAEVHRLVENALMHQGLYDSAREYITYRAEHKPDLFRKRVAYRPFEYLHLHGYADAIRKSYWTHDEFDFTGDIQDFRVKMSTKEKEATRRCILAIAHVEASVKSFWVNIGNKMPKAEIAEVGITFGESEVRHANAYAELLNLLGLNDEFEKILHVPVFKARQRYMEQSLANKDMSNKDYLKSLMFFSLFIENVSLFSQFLVVMMINQKQGYLKGTSNVISSTALEEQIHFMFGVDIVNEARKENPQWFDSEWTKEVYDLVQESYQAEIAIIDWIFEQGEIDAVSKSTIVEYIKSRYNVGLTSAGFTAPFVVNPDLLKDTEFFDLQLSTTTHVDFFHKRSSNYTKKTMAFDADSLF